MRQVYEFGMFGEGQNCYSHLNIADTFASLALTTGVLGIYYVIGRSLPKKVMDVTNEISSNITAVYCIHWVLVSVIVNLLVYIIRGTQELLVWIVMILGSGISVVSIMIAHYFKLWKERCVKYEKVS